MNHQLKKYVIHILAVPALTYDVFDIPLENCAFIICTNRSNYTIDNIIQKNKLVLDFLDVEDADLPRAFNRGHARKIIQFLLNLPSNVSDIYVCCSKGGSRSAGCAAALLKMSGRNDKKVWLNPYYTPNILVYKILCREYGIFMPDWRVDLLNKLNEWAFRKAQKKGNSGKYERWQILF